MYSLIESQPKVIAGVAQQGVCLAVRQLARALAVDAANEVALAHSLLGRLASWIHLKITAKQRRPLASRSLRQPRSAQINAPFNLLNMRFDQIYPFRGSIIGRTFGATLFAS